MTVLRGGLVVTIFEKVVRLREDSEIESKATTMMISDVQRIVGGIEYLYEVGAGLVETGLATYLLYRMVGISCITILGLALRTFSEHIGQIIMTARKLLIQQKLLVFPALGLPRR